MSGWGPYIHPIVQGVVLSLGLTTLALGLRLRRLRRTAASSSPGPQRARLAARHMRLGRWFTGLFAAGYLLGLGGMRFALGEPLYGTAHSYFATLGLFLVGGTAYLGRRLRLRGDRDDLRQLHIFCAFLAVFLTLGVGFLGMILLP